VELKVAMDLLFSDRSDLKYLADLSGLEGALFYRYADLRGLDLSGQDLSGLNFDWADLRGANISNVIFSEGSFNNSLLSEEYSGLKDNFDCYPYDFEEIFAQKLMVYGKFRPQIFDRLFSSLRMTFSEISSQLGISPATLRKVRVGGVVSKETISSVWRGLSDFDVPIKAADNFSEFMVDFTHQPSVQLGEYSGYGKFLPLKRREFLEAVQNFEIYNDLNPIEYRRDGVLVYEERPSTLKRFIAFYNRTGRLPGFSAQQMLDGF